MADFFGIKTMGEIEKEEQEEVESLTSVKSVKTDAGNTPLHPSPLRKDGTPRANFYFSPEDEEEIRKAAYGVSGITYQGKEAKDAMDKVYDRVAEEVIERVQKFIKS